MRRLFIFCTAASLSLLVVVPVGAQDPDFVFEIDSQIVRYESDGSAEFAVSLFVRERDGGGVFPNEIEGLTLRLTYDSSLITDTDVSIGTDLGSIDGGNGPDLFTSSTCEGLVTIV